MRGSSPIRTQSALTSAKPAPRAPARRHRAAARASRRPPSARRRKGNSEPMSPSPAAPSSASVSAWADHVAVGVARKTARMIEGDAAENERDTVLERVRVDAEADPELRHASASGSSDNEGSGLRARRASNRCPQGPRRMWTASMPASIAGPDVVVDAVADVGDLAGGEAALRDDPLEELRRGLLDPPALGRADQVDVLAQQLLGLGGCVADGADEEAQRAEPGQAGQRVGIEVVRAPTSRPGARRRGSPRRACDAPRGPPARRGRPSA